MALSTRYRPLASRKPSNATGRIFSARSPPKTTIGKLCDVLRCAVKPKYDPRALRNTIIDIIGASTSIGDLKHPSIIPTVCLTKGGPQIFKTNHHRDFSRDHRLKAVDVALATSAAPSYFPIAEIGDGLYADGGLYANSPDLIAIHEAEHFFRADITDIRILSIGTTTSKFSFALSPTIPEPVRPSPMDQWAAPGAGDPLIPAANR